MTPDAAPPDPPARAQGGKRRRSAWAWLSAGWVALLCATFLLGGLRVFRMSSPRYGNDLTPYDTAGYLLQAQEIQDMGGAGVWLWRCYMGRYPNANQMPLFILALTGLRLDTVSALVYAQMIALVFGAASVVATYVVTSRCFNRASGVLASAFVGRAAYLYFSSIVACESLLALWIVLAWGAMARFAKRGRGARWMGACVGLAYMTKGTGLFLLPVGALVCAFGGPPREAAADPAPSREGASRRRRLLDATRRAARRKPLWLFLAFFALVASPILVRNVVRYRSPFYTVNQHVLWMDSWDQFSSLDEAERKPTLFSFLRTHTAQDIADRISDGLSQQLVYLIVVSGVPALCLAAAACFRRKWQTATTPAGGIVVIFFFFFTWYPVKDFRFMIPLLPLIAALAAAGLWWVLDAVGRLAGRYGRALAPALMGMLAALYMGSVILAVATGPSVLRDPVANQELPPHYRQLLELLRNRIPGDATWAVGPTHRYEFAWLRPLPGRPLAIPYVTTPERLFAWVREAGVRYLVLDHSSLTQRLKAFAGYVEPDGIGLRLLRAPPGWRLIAESATRPRLFLVFAIAPPAAAPEDRSVPHPRQSRAP